MKKSIPDKKTDRDRKLLEKSREMEEFDRQYKEASVLCGVDEAGRGPLAGPVVAAALILPEAGVPEGINDSKVLSPKKRETLFEALLETAVSWGIGVESSERIDSINILQATYRAMKSAVENLTVRPDLLLNDAVRIPGLAYPQIPIIKGDAKSRVIAGASILAKVTRDRMMEALDREYPMYGFARHKGYGTKEHMEAIERYGLSPVHRKSFCKKFLEGTASILPDDGFFPKDSAPLFPVRDTRRIGSHYEERAARYLRERGVCILVKNFRTRFGEIDLIGRDKEFIVFFEVKYRRNDNWGFSLEAVDEKKQAKIKKTAEYFLMTERLLSAFPIRFDCIGFDREEVIWLQDAF